MLRSTTLLLAFIIPLTSCLNTHYPSNPNVSHKNTKTLLQSTDMVVRASIDGAAPFDWTVMPELVPDRLVVQCPTDQKVKVKFQSDIEEVSYLVSNYDAINFYIQVGDVAGKTQIKCTAPARNYSGNYTPDRPTIGQYDADLAPIFDAYIFDNEAGGIMTIWEKGALVYTLSRGKSGADLQSSRHITDAFDIASVSKEFTAIVILQLIEQGKLTLETKVEDFFPGLPNGEHTTIYHLLAHTHGLPDYTEAQDYDTSKLLAVNDVISALQSMDAVFFPGTEYQYGNTSYLLLALIAERLTGQTHSAYIRENLFKPAGMGNSYFLTDANTPNKRVIGFNQIDGIAEVMTKTKHPSHSVGIGDIVSTFGDLQKWYQALASGKIISKKMFAEATTLKTLNDGSSIERGFAFYSDKISGETVIYNSGDYYTHTRYLYFTEQDRMIAINTNNTIEYHEYIASDIYLHVVGKMLNREKYMHFGEETDLTDL